MPIKTFKELEDYRAEFDSEVTHRGPVNTGLWEAATSAELGSLHNMMYSNRPEEIIRGYALEGQKAPKAELEAAAKYLETQILDRWEDLKTATQLRDQAEEQALVLMRREEAVEYEHAPQAPSTVVLNAQYAVLCWMVGAQWHHAVTRVWYGPIERHPAPGTVLRSSDFYPEDESSITGD